MRAAAPGYSTHAGKGLDDGDLVGKTDAYAYIEIDGCDPQQTKCISGTLNPEWNETRGPASFLPNVAPAPAHAVSHRFTFKIDKPLGKELKVKVYDKDLGMRATHLRRGASRVGSLWADGRRVRDPEQDYKAY